MTFEFATAGRVIFGPGTRREVGSLVRAFGTRALLITGRDRTRADPVLQMLKAAGVETEGFALAGEPTLAAVERGAALARDRSSEVVIGLGGGSAIDAAKAVAALATNLGPALDYLEVIGAGRPLKVAPLPCVAIPTTAGTGAEVTRNSVLASPEHRVKVSLRHPRMLPRIALVDSELTMDLPPGLTASTGLDALTQVIEPYVCNRANPLVDSLCVEGIRRSARSLRRAFDTPGDASARDDLALASLCGGLALANAGLGAVHGFAAPLGGMFPAPHGAVCAALLPHVMAANIRALRERSPESGPLARYDEIARLLTGRPQAVADDGVAWVVDLCAALGIARLRTFGVDEAGVPTVVEKAAQASSMKANPIALTVAELTAILRTAL